MDEEPIAARRLRNPFWRIATFSVGSLILFMTGVRDWAWFHSSVPVTPVGVFKTVLVPLLGLSFMLIGLVPPKPKDLARPEGPDLRQSGDRPTL